MRNANKKKRSVTISSPFPHAQSQQDAHFHFPTQAWQTDPQKDQRRMNGPMDGRTDNASYIYIYI